MNYSTKGTSKAQLRKAAELASLLDKAAQAKERHFACYRAFLAEIDRASKLSPQKQKSYLEGFGYLTQGVAQLNEHKCRTARALLGESLKRFSISIGEQSLSNGLLLYNIGRANYLLQDFAAAKGYLERATVVLKATTGEDNPKYGAARFFFTELSIETGDLDQAETVFRAILEKERYLRSGPSVDYLRALLVLGRVSTKKGRLIEAEALFFQVERLVKQQGTDDDTMALIFEHQAEFNVARGEYKEAEANLARSLALLEKIQSPWSPAIAMVLDRRVAVLRKLDRMKDASDAEARARKIRAAGGRTPA